MASPRGDLLWKLDVASKLRFSHENPDVKSLYSKYLREPLRKRPHHLLHTNHSAWVISFENHSR
ncbi:iron hydrogenase small subunit [Oscillibacter sp.]|uniref:iron hydrogenase small subunit n=1 Tax=Oscillibacter sp. TaxID=1945593 RepID=UPI0028B1F891|nr:iron hydrogenase small subunit [Oscillibacter sp.]